MMDTGNGWVITAAIMLGLIRRFPSRCIRRRRPR